MFMIKKRVDARRSTTILTFAMWLILSGSAAVSMAAQADDAKAAAKKSAPVAEYSKRGAKGCLLCHGEGKMRDVHEVLMTPMGVSGDPASPMSADNHGCETCHGPTDKHPKRKEDGSRFLPPVTFDDKTPVETQNAVCLGCHNNKARFHWPGSVHDVEGVACADCHVIHKADDPVLSVETQPAVCYKCHKEQRAQFLRQSRHPVQGASASMSNVGLIACSDCHNPHGSAGPALLKRNTVNEQCYDCHAEKRGPFLWEHAPVTEDCTVCHTPHGSNYENLLVARPPFLCQQCHAAQFHSSEAFSGTGVPPNGADRHLLGKQCMNCHVQIHGSNHPSGARLTR